MKKYLSMLCFGAFILAGCEKEKLDIPEEPNYDVRHLNITCVYHGVEHDLLNPIELDSDGAELIFEVKEGAAYFSCFQYWDDKDKFNRELVQFHYYKGIDNYECDLFELKQIDESHFKVRILPTEQYFQMSLDFNPHGELAAWYGWGRMYVVMNAKWDPSKL